MLIFLGYLMKVKVIAPLEFENSHHDFAIHYVSHYTTKASWISQREDIK